LSYTDAACKAQPLVYSILLRTPKSKLKEALAGLALR